MNEEQVHEAESQRLPKEVCEQIRKEDMG